MLHGFLTDELGVWIVNVSSSIIVSICALMIRRPCYLSWWWKVCALNAKLKDQNSRKTITRAVTNKKFANSLKLFISNWTQFSRHNLRYKKNISCNANTISRHIRTDFQVHLRSLMRTAQTVWSTAKKDMFIASQRTAEEVQPAAKKWWPRAVDRLRRNPKSNRAFRIENFQVRDSQNVRLTSRTAYFQHKRQTICANFLQWASHLTSGVLQNNLWILWRQSFLSQDPIKCLQTAVRNGESVHLVILMCKCAPTKWLSGRDQMD